MNCNVPIKPSGRTGLWLIPGSFFVVVGLASLLYLLAWIVGLWISRRAPKASS